MILMIMKKIKFPINNHIFIFIVLYLSSGYALFSFEKKQIDSLDIKYESFLKSNEYEDENYKMFETLSQHYRTSNPLKSFEITKNGLQYAFKNNHLLGQQLLYTKLANLYYDNGMYPSALENYQHSFEIAVEENRLGSAAFSLNDIGYVYFQLDKSKIALDFYKKAIDYAKNNLIENPGDIYPLSHSYANAAYTYSALNMPDSQYIMLQNNLKLNNKIQDEKGSKKALFYLGKYYSDKKLDSALKYFKQTLNYAKNKSFEPESYANTLTGIAETYAYFDKQDSAIFYFNKSIDELKKINFYWELSSNYHKFAKYLTIKNQYNKAIQLLDSAEFICNKYNYQSVLTAIYEQKSQLFIKEEKYLKALEYKDKLFYLTKELEMSKITAKTLLIVKELENFKSSRELDLIVEKNNQLLILYTIIIVMIIAGLIVLYFQFRAKQNRNIELMMSNKTLEALNKKLDITNKEKDKFMSILAHDMRNPIYGIYNSLSMLKTNWELFSKEEMKKFIDSYVTSAFSITELLEKLLAWSRVQSGRIKFSPSKLFLNEVITNNISLVKINADIKKININIDISEDIYLIADEEMLNTIIRNLLTNAIKFTKNGGEIKVSAKLRNNSLIFKIKDNGIGIGKESLQKLLNKEEIFNTFGTNNENGTGLGFNLIINFIEAHEGRINVNSEIGKGTEFIIELSTDLD